jgi:hypothetical protein
MTDTKDEVIDLTTNRAEIIEWLRTSGGPLGERTTKHAAADLLEQEASPRLLLINTQTGQSLDITFAVRKSREVAFAFEAAVEQYARDKGCDHDEAVERLTANYSRAEFEEGGYLALQDLIRYIDAFLGNVDA